MAEKIVTTFVMVVAVWVFLVFGVGPLIDAWVSRGGRRRR